MVDDAAEAVDGFAAGMTRARTAASQAADASGDLALSFERMREVTQIQVGGQQPLEGLSQPFAASSLSFRRLSGSLAQMADALDNSALDTARVADDLQVARNRMDNMAATVEALRPRLLAGRGLSSIELGMRSVLAFILVQAVLSMLTGLAILLLSGSKRASE
jgi:methyl-accepting chemotaxis protein